MMKTLTGIIAAAALAMSRRCRQPPAISAPPTSTPPTIRPSRPSSSWASSSRRQSGGKLGVKVYPNGALGTEKDTIEQLKIGGLDMMRINVGAAEQRRARDHRAVPAVRLPLDTSTCARCSTARSATRSSRRWSPQGLIGLAFYDSGARSIYTVKKPIKTLADIKGLKIRVQQSDLFVGMIEALGANPTPMPYGEVYTALKTGIVDAAENNWPSYESSRHFEAAKYYNVTEHSLAPEVLVFSKKVWDTLTQGGSGDDPQGGQGIGARTCASSGTSARQVAQDGRGRRRPGDHDRRTRQEFVDAMKPVYAKFADTPKLQSLVKRIQDTK